MLRRLSVVFAAVLLLAPGIKAQAPAQQAAGEPKTVWTSTPSSGARRTSSSISFSATTIQF